MGIFERLAEGLDELAGERGSAPPHPEDRDSDEGAVARALEPGGGTEGALARLGELARRHPRSFDILEARGDLLRGAGRLEEAAADFGRAVDLGSRRPSTWLKLGETLAGLRRLEPARDALRRALALPATQASERARAWLALGGVYGRLGQPSKAIRELKKCVELAPQSAEAVAALGRAMLADGDWQGAEWLARAARLPGGDVALLVDAARERAAAEAAPGEESEARLDGETSSGHREVGEKDPGADPDLTRDPALRWLREAAARAPTLPGVRSALARRLGELGQPSAAREEAELETAAHPLDLEAWTTLREVLARSGDFVAALEVSERERTLGGKLPPAEALRLALGARSVPALLGLRLVHPREGERASEGEVPARADDPGAAEAEADLAAASAFCTGTADPRDVARLLRRAPDDGAREFVLAALAPPPVPTGSELGLLTWARDFVVRAGADSMRALFAIPGDLLSLAVPLARAVEAFDRPLLLAVMGEFNAGKSSFVNALVGAEVARVGVTPTTATVNILRYGVTSGGRVRFRDGAVRDLRTDQLAGYLASLDDVETARIRAIEVFSPAESLRRIEIVDTPGLNALDLDHARVARAFVREADAVVWVFALGQAAKATEREALEDIRGADKRILGVLNKIDGAEPGDVEAVKAHVARELGARLTGLVPFSARAALRARVEGAGEAALVASGLRAVESALEETFFAHARQLKRATALATAGRFAREAREAISLTEASIATEIARVAGERAGLAINEAHIRSTLAAERVALRARVDRALRAAASEVRELGHPMAWPFGPPRFDASAESDLVELLDDAIGEAVADTARVLRASLTNEMAAAALPAATRGELDAILSAALDGFAAYARGRLEGSAALFFRADAARSRLELKALSNLLSGYAPDPEPQLFHPLARSVAAVFARARGALGAAAADLELRRLSLDRLIVRPLAELGQAAQGATEARVAPAPPLD